MSWPHPDEALVHELNAYYEQCTSVYSSDHNRIAEDTGKERGIAEGGYGRKQIQELIQNAADALLRQPGRVHVVLDESCLYVANEGEPFTSTGLRALLYTHLSNKTGDEIGRFGLGFKAIAGISDCPQVYSRSISFEFNRSRSATELAAILDEEFSHQDVPALRLAWNIDARQAFADDSLLADLNWATTIVKAPLRPDAAADLSKEIAAFDETFSLFAPHVSSLTLDDRVSGSQREFRTTKRGNQVTLSTEGSESEWLVFSREHRPSIRALESAGYSASREKVTVSWAVPQSTRERGSLCAFFPVKSEVTLKGRLNAPWKLSDDRINVIECLFNQELLEQVVPALVVDARQEIVARYRFSRYIDILPARGKERHSWADQVINKPVYDALRDSRCLPDLNGTLHSPTQIKCIPAGLESWADEWLEHTTDRTRWVHPDCVSTSERRSKVERLMTRQGSEWVGRVKTWIEGIVSDHSLPPRDLAAKSVAAITLGDAIVSAWPTGSAASKLQPARDEIREARIVLLTGGDFQSPMPGRCFIAPNVDASGGALINRRVSDVPDALEALKRFGIGEFDDGSDLLQILQNLRNARVPDWDLLWTALRSTSLETVRMGFNDVLDGHAPRVVKVKGAEGQWVEARGRFLPGRLQPRKQDSRFFVDRSFHTSDRDILALLGVHDCPRPNTLHPREPWVGKYRDSIVDSAGEKWKLGPLKRQEVTVDGLDRVLGPLAPLPEMAVENQVALTDMVLSSVTASKTTVKDPQSNRRSSVTAPELFWLRKNGIISTDLGPVPIAEVFTQEALDSAGMPAGIVPVVPDLDVSSDVLAELRLQDTLDKLTADVLIASQSFHVENENATMLGQVYAWWCHLFPDERPERVFASTSQGLASMETREVTLVVNDTEEEQLHEFGIPFLHVPGEDAASMAALWGFNEASSLPIAYEFDTSAEPATFSDLFPGVFVAEDPEIEDAVVQPCSEIRKIARIPGSPAVEIDAPHGRHEGMLLVTGVTDIDRLSNVLDAIGADNSPEQLDLYRDQMRDNRQKHKIFGLKNFTSDAARLLDLVGESRLISLVPKNAQPMLDKDSLTGISLAELCVTLHGAGALEQACQVDKSALEIVPPDRWGGSLRARKWVTDLGFPERWAGVRYRSTAKPSEYVDGPSELPPLHRYQQEVSEQLAQVISGGPDEPKRAIVMLPTGSGKTRVAVQTVVDMIAGGELDDTAEFRGPVLWLADTEELCEQAVGTWVDIWRSRGRSGTQLIVSRFWGSHDLNEDSANGAVQIVVASWQKLIRATESTEYEWLRDTPIVLIDEAHGAIHKSYTAILEWLHRDQYSRDRILIGLTATPFRGSGEDSDESKRLRRRFDDNIITFKTDDGIGPLKHLQRLTVLSKVTTEALDGVDIELSKKDTQHLLAMRTLPKQNETKLGEDEGRTSRIVESILSKPADWPILVFATSVDNARVLATVLTAVGRPAASIDQETSPGARRDIIQRFKDGKLKVITNYGVLSQGFDAPATRAVYVTRPTSSAVLYRQMVGRGMRGPMNGGTSDVLIVNLLDTIIRHKDALEEIRDKDSHGPVEEIEVKGLPMEAINEDFGDGS